MLELVASISEKVGKISGHKELESRPHLRRNNRIKSIHSSLKIEANSLSLSEVREVIDGHLVFGNQKEIQEVKNAYAAYEEIDKIKPYSIADLRRIHQIMTYLTVADSGMFRKSDEGVFSGDKCIFAAPPPYMVSELMKELFDWMKKNENKVHPLILSSVFHYEFVFIHPFSDGNVTLRHQQKAAQLSARSTNILKYPLWLDKSKCLMKGGFFMLGVSDIFLIR